MGATFLNTVLGGWVVTYFPQSLFNRHSYTKSYTSHFLILFTFKEYLWLWTVTIQIIISQRRTSLSFFPFELFCRWFFFMNLTKYNSDNILSDALFFLKNTFPTNHFQTKYRSATFSMIFFFLETLLSGQTKLKIA